MTSDIDRPPDMPPPSGAAYFLDFDGTLVDIAATPDGIDIPGDLGPMLAALREAAGGALAVISGRTLDDLRRFLPDLGPPMVGGHGAEWWLDGDPEPHPAATGPAVPEMIAAAHAAAEGTALLVEEKPTGVVLHFRADPDLAPQARAEAGRIAALHPGFEVHPAKMAYEVRPDDVGKDSAVARLMGKPPFSGRIPVFAGDDTTDEVAIAWVEGNGGLGVKVGEGESAARLRLASPADVRALISDLT